MFKTDSVENTEKYRFAMMEINPILENEFKDKFGMGICHSYWHRKKELLAKYGIDWKSPAELNPDIRFD